MRRKWWKAYFFFALAVTVCGFAVVVFFDDGADQLWWEWIDIPLYSLQLVGLFGFAYWRRLGSPSLWQFILVATVLYEAWNLYSMASDPELKETAHMGFVITTLAATLLLQVPMFIGLFLYGFGPRSFGVAQRKFSWNARAGAVSLRVSHSLWSPRSTRR
jgi:hypothetical protein